MFGLSKLVDMLRILLMVKGGVFVAKMLAFFGLAVATSKFAIDPLVDQLEGLINTGGGSALGATALQWAGVLKFDVALSMILSAYTAAWTIKTAKAFIMKVD